MRLTIFGASGQTGTQLVQQALRDGHVVTAVIRNPRRLEIQDPALTVVTVGDFSDAVGVRAAVEGAEAVLSGVGPRARKDAPIASPATRSILTAMSEADVRRIVVISAAPVGPAPSGDSFLNRRVMLPMVGAILRPVYDDLRAMEADLAASDLEWTAFRPPRLTNGGLTRSYRTSLGTRVPRGTSISRADLASAMLAALGQPETERMAVGVAY